MASNEDWVDLPVEKTAEGADDWQDVSLEPDYKGAAQAGLEHFGNAASFGYLPQLQAMAEKPMAKVLDALTGNKVAEDLPDYVDRRDENIERLKRQELDHPVASTAGTIGGTLASAIPTGAALSKVPALARFSAMEAPEGAALASRVAALAGRTAGVTGAAAIQGALSNPGDVEGEVDPLQLKERGKQSALSASIAAPLHLAGEGLSSVGKYIGSRLKDKAEGLAFRALGPFKRQVNQNRDEIKEIGREALDSGVVRWKPGSAATLEERAQDAVEGTGKKLGDLTRELTGLEDEATASGMSRKQIADNLRNKLIIDNEASIPAIDERNKTFSNMIGAFENRGRPVLSFSDLRKAKMAVQGTDAQDGLINWNRLKNADVPIEEQFHRALASELREGEEAGASAIEKAYYGQDSNRMSDLKTKLGLQKAAAQITANKADAQRANQILGLKDAIYGGAGATIGGTIGYQLDGYEGAKAGAGIGGAIGTVGNKLARDYGSQVSAKSADLLAKVIAQSPKLGELVEKNPTLIPSLINSLREKDLTPSIPKEEIRNMIGKRYQRRKLANEGDER